MDNNLKGNPSAINYGGGFKPKGLQPFPNFANSNTMKMGKTKSNPKKKIKKKQSQNVGLQGQNTTAKIRK